MSIEFLTAAEKARAAKHTKESEVSARLGKESKRKEAAKSLMKQVDKRDKK